MALYRGLILDDPREAPSEEAIAQLEARLGARLPDDYRQYLAACNAAEQEYDVVVTLADGAQETMSFSLFGLDPDEDWEFNPHELEQLREVPDFPESGLLPIGRDGGSSLLLLDLRDGRQQVAAMVAGLPAWTGRRQNGDEYVVLAESFNDYLDLLHIADASIESHIERFIINPDTIDATLDWLDQGSPGWRERFREQWNARVTQRLI
ncbi:SMI1/KNR4 family protein [Pseudomonas sp. DTU_2021_1001937_2_SI_NGA_ILE_001]|uniref:SMI1/KNR4 family protein n=1 Tax=Pseudomonas sp. DTU_2021_1001937_2_SI_NGA_ILE_001 TaxID=3077589 RepID=UPI0028FC1662|nr:SMI1/KNR4 family protein [Pseudomonas sp. DTU_2021_1001937_2_SI_NGA_ILE_001]WNW13913.1 SMI1/KNR4 family protein [Pseudomonas sp. DTU_2021_1001937_2_SI_NGA_ILE_001]